MNDIKKTYTIQWVGPFHSLGEYKVYLQREDTCDKSLFSFYYFIGNKKGKGYKKTLLYDYFGIHKGNDITSRLNKCHEHFKDFHINENLNIWFGSFANIEDQTPSNIKEVETVFISSYKPTENIKEINSAIDESICIVNLWYKKADEKPWIRKPQSAAPRFDDVIIYEVEEAFRRVLSGKLKEVRTP